MASIPGPIHSTVSLIDQHHANSLDMPRPHFGVSQLGNKDERAMWLNFRWAFQEQFDGRILRLFRRGHNEEKTVVEDLRAIGCEMEYVLNDQLQVHFGSHVSGSPDGVITSGLPEAPSTPHLLEIKTASKKKFDEFVKNGVEKTNPTYWVQVHVGMHGITSQSVMDGPVERCLFVVVCKDDDRIYTERIKLNKTLAIDNIERGQRIATSYRMPEPHYIDPSNFEAKWSPYYALYFPKSATQAHLDRLKTQREGEGLYSKVSINCRSCAYSHAMPDSTWRCDKFNADNIPLDFQRKGCESHELHHDIVYLLEGGNA